MRILVAEDREDLRFVLSLSLKTLGHTVVEAEDGLEALVSLIEEGPFDLMITDIQMPHVHGIDLVLALRINGFEDMPVIVSSGRLSLAGHPVFKAWGKMVFLFKPWHIDQLEAQIKKVMNV